MYKSHNNKSDEYPMHPFTKATLERAGKNKPIFKDRANISEKKVVSSGGLKKVPKTKSVKMQVSGKY